MSGVVLAQCSKYLVPLISPRSGPVRYHFHFTDEETEPGESEQTCRGSGAAEGELGFEPPLPYCSALASVPRPNMFQRVLLACLFNLIRSLS